MSDVNNTVSNLPASSQGGEEGLHYSDQTLAALVEHHGWHYYNPNRPASGVERLFAGLGPDGDMVPNGARYLGANYSKDPESRRYIALHYGFDLLKDWDGREGTPAEIAAQVNKWAEQYVQMERAKLKAA
ncbi:hypothetical protein [Acetobacter fabarum]|uniref:hypothetical protein n=1 Tax=Acetobacter fabarum TaxID=483199 RepID=UPI0033A578B3